MPSDGSIIEFPIKSFLGLNLKDAGDRVKDNEFVKLQNVWQPTKGTFNPRWGSIADQSAFSMAKRVSGVWRHYAATGDRMMIYHCEPDSTPLPDNTTDLTLTEVHSPTPTGNIFGGGSVVTIRVCYSWIGRGLEQTYNSKNRANFPASGAFPLNAWANPAHQTITLSNAGSNLQVTIPAFPTGITGANIFISLDSLTQMTYMGTITTSGGSLTISEFIGPNAAAFDYVPNYMRGSSQTATTNAPLTPNPTSAYIANAANINGGMLKPGAYYIGYAWVVDPNVKEGNLIAATAPVQYGGNMVALFTGGSLADSATAGSLLSSTNYSAVLTVVDAITGLESAVSGVFTGTTGSSHTSLQLTTPALPTYSAPGSLFNLYVQKNGDSALYAQLTWFGISPSSSYNIGTYSFAGSTPIAPSAQVNITEFPFVAVQVGSNQNAIVVNGPGKFSLNGAQAAYVFIGTQDPSLQPMTCVGVVRATTDATSILNVLAIPAHNAQSCPPTVYSDLGSSSYFYLQQFWAGVNDQYVGGMNKKIGQPCQVRFGFMEATKNGGSLYEIFPSRTLLPYLFNYSGTPTFLKIYAGQAFQTNPNFPVEMAGPSVQMRTANDLYKASTDTNYVQPYAWVRPTNDPTFCFMNGITYIANGVDVPWKTDGFTLAQMSPVGVALTANVLNQANPALVTTLPPIPRFIFAYQNSLIFTGGQCGNQLYASNAEAAQNFAVAGSGQLLRFVTPGDAAGSVIRASGIFTPASDSPQGGTNNPNSQIITFKKVGIWMNNTIPDPTTSAIAGLLSGQVPASMVQVSGHIGCVAPRSVCLTPLGTVFLGTDANVYLINRVAEPTRFGTKVQNGLIHLVGNDTAMLAVTAVYHDNHYKISYPSPAAALITPVVNDSEFWADLRTEEGDPVKWYGPMQGRNIGAQVVLAGDGDNLTRIAANAGSPSTFVADSISALDDLGTEITTILTSKIYRFQGEDTHQKRQFGCFMDMYIDDSYSNTVLFQGFADANYSQVNRTLSIGNAVWDSSQWDQSNYADASWQGFDFLFGSDNLGGRTFQFSIQKADKAPWVLEAVTLLMKAEKRRVIN